MAPIIGFVGYGNINTVLATLAVKAGYQVVISNSRGPETLVNAVAKLGPNARAASVTDAIKQSDIVSVSVPLKNYTLIPAEAAAGKIVIDTLNYYPQRDGAFEDLDNHSITSSELVQRHFKDAHVVKAFNNISFINLYHGALAAGDPKRWSLPIAGDNADAKAAVTKFIDAIGFDVADIGSLAESWRFQPWTPVYGVPYVATFPESATGEDVLESQRKDQTRAAKPEDIRALADKAVHGETLETPPLIQKFFAAVALSTQTAELQGQL